MTSPGRERARKAREALADIPAQLAALRAMTVSQLRQRYLEVYGETCRSHNKDRLRKQVAWRIQELAEGGLSKRARARIEELAAFVSARWRSKSGGAAAAGQPAAATPVAPPAARDPRLPPPGTVLSREHEGVEHRVTVLADGFEFQGERFASLSKIAQAITGTPWNGFLFFRLQRRVRGAGKAAA